MNYTQEIAALLLRISLSAGFLSAVASRLNLWGKHSSGWNNFVAYTAQVNSFAPTSLSNKIAIITTVLETTLGLFLLIGFKTNYTALAAAILTLLFGIAMSISSGIKEPLDYSVFAFSAGAFLLSTIKHSRWTIDNILS